VVKDDMLVGVNWSGARAAGYEIEPLQQAAAADERRAGEGRVR
jgi:hypothetical protein